MPRKSAFADLASAPFPRRQPRPGRNAPADDYGPLANIMIGKKGGITTPVTLGTHSLAIKDHPTVPVEVPHAVPAGWPLKGFTVIPQIKANAADIMRSPAYQASTTCTYFSLWASTLLNKPSGTSISWQHGTKISTKKNSDTYQNVYQEWEKAIGSIDRGKDDTTNLASAIQKIESSDDSFTLLNADALDGIRTAPRSAFKTTDEFIASVTCLLDRGFAVAISPRNHAIVLVGYSDYSFLALSSFNTTSVPAMYRSDPKMFAEYRADGVGQTFQDENLRPYPDEYFYYRNFMRIPKRFVCSAFMDADMAVPISFRPGCYKY
ncbi:MAG: hypothetical protein ACPGR8_06910 [Limisphaerales bacterium]